MRAALVVITVVLAAGCGRFGSSKETPEQAAAKKKRQEARRKRENEAKAAGVALALDLAEIARDALGAGKKKIDPAKMERFRAADKVVEAMVIRTEKGRMFLAGSARAKEAPRISKTGESEKLAGEVLFTRGKLGTGEEATPVWVFEVRLNNAAGDRMGQAMIFLEPPTRPPRK